MKCLILDSSKSFRMLLAHLVQERGFQCEHYATGEDGLKRVDETSFDLVFVSMYLDDMEGSIFAACLRGNPRTSRIPLVMITSSAEKHELDRAVAVGVTEVFAKKQVAEIDEYVVQFMLKHGAVSTLLGDILYVEDSRAVAMKTKALLESLGLSVDHYTTAEAALEAFSEKEYDLVLTDIVLEGQMSGYGLLRALRGFSGVRQRIPVLAMSAFNDDTRKIELLVSGANDYVSKPALDEELIARVKNLLTSKKQLDLIEQQSLRMQEMAMRDQLTGLHNRHFLMEMVVNKLSEAKRQDFAVSLLIIDADKFKSINDTHGHATGDEVLRSLANTLKENCRGEDVAARFGGEEFVVLLSHCNERCALQKAEQLRCLIEASKPAGLRVTASFGVAEFDKNAMKDFSDLFNAADQAVYVAKDTGRNKVVIASSILAKEEKLVGAG